VSEKELQKLVLSVAEGTRANALPLAIIPHPVRAGIKGWVVVQVKSIDTKSHFQPNASNTRRTERMKVTIHNNV